jgi:uncharacterized protein YycO
MKLKKIQALENMACNMVGDGKTPSLFFVTRDGVVVTVTRDFSIAYSHWNNIANYGGHTTSIEDRKNGVICSYEWDRSKGRFVRVDNSAWVTS